MGKKQRPGFMVFHEDMQFVEVMTDEDAGKLFKAMLQYSCAEQEPQFTEGMLRIGWAIVKPMIERDKRRYQAVCDSNSYSAYCKNADARGEVRMSKEEYLAARDRGTAKSVRMHANGSECMRFVPTTTTTATPTSTPTATTASAGTLHHSGERDLGALYPYDEKTFEKKRRERLNMIPVC